MQTAPRSTSTNDLDGTTPGPPHRPMISLVVPAFNESAVVGRNLPLLCEHMRGLDKGGAPDGYDWEILVVNDGSHDDTSALAKAIAAGCGNVVVLDHPVNFGLGQALKFAFNRCRGDYIVVMDMDLSYSPDHIDRLVETLRRTGAKVVIASPYLAGGRVENVPALRKWLSVGANKFLSMAAHGRVKTLTGMVRGYDARFLRTVDFYSMGMEVNSEILYKAMVLRARIEEIPATLKWHDPPPAEPVATDEPPKPVRRSSMRVVKYIATLLVAGFLYRPVLFFFGPGLASLCLSAACLVWAVFAKQAAVPLVGFATFAMSGVQLLAFGLCSTQAKCYFEQMFHLGTTNYRASRDRAAREGSKEHARTHRSRVA